MDIILSKHAREKIAERQIDRVLINKVLRQPEFLYYDFLSKAYVAIRRVEICFGVCTNLIVAFRREEEELLVITVYPCKNLKKELNKEGRRWVRVQREG